MKCVEKRSIIVCCAHTQYDVVVSSNELDDRSFQLVGFNVPFSFDVCTLDVKKTDFVIIRQKRVRACTIRLKMTG